MQADSNTYILDHIFEFTFSKLDAHAKVVLLTLANAPVDVTGNLIANSIVFKHSEEVENLIYNSPDEVEKSLGLLVKFGLVSQLKDDQKSTDARISLSSKYRIPLITCIYAKSRHKKFDENFSYMLLTRFRYNLLKYDSNSAKDRKDLIEFLIVWADIAVAILEGFDPAEIPTDVMDNYKMLGPFLGIVYTNTKRLPLARFNANATLYNSDASQAFMEFIKALLLIINKYQGRTGSHFFHSSTLHPRTDPLNLFESPENSENNPHDDNLDEGEDYKDYIQIRATITFNLDEDLLEIAPYNHFILPQRIE